MLIHISIFYWCWTWDFRSRWKRPGKQLFIYPSNSKLSHWSTAAGIAIRLPFSHFSVIFYYFLVQTLQSDHLFPQVLWWLVWIAEGDPFIRQRPAHHRVAALSHAQNDQLVVAQALKRSRPVVLVLCNTTFVIFFTQSVCVELVSRLVASLGKCKFLEPIDRVHVAPIQQHSSAFLCPAFSPTIHRHHIGYSYFCQTD